MSNPPRLIEACSNDIQEIDRRLSRRFLGGRAGQIETGRCVGNNRIHNNYNLIHDQLFSFICLDFDGELEIWNGHWPMNQGALMDWNGLRCASMSWLRDGSGWQHTEAHRYSHSQWCDDDHYWDHQLSAPLLGKLMPFHTEIPMAALAQIPTSMELADWECLWLAMSAGSK